MKNSLELNYYSLPSALDELQYPQSTEYLLLVGPLSEKNNLEAYAVALVQLLGLDQSAASGVPSHDGWRYKIRINLHGAAQQALDLPT